MAPLTQATRRATLRQLIATFARTPVQTIAVVGNAPLVESTERAARIDACDLVVRMTSFVLDRALPAAGTKTDVVLVHRGTITSPDTFSRYAERLYILVEPGRRHWEPSTMPHWWPADLGLVHWPNDLFSDQLVQTLGYDRRRPEWATTGTLAAWSMRMLFPGAHTYLTGFSIVDDPNQTELDHAWGEGVPLTAEHRLHDEAALIHSWVEDGDVTLLR